MNIRGLILLGVPLLASGCHDHRTNRIASPQDPPWLVVRVDAVNVSPFRPGLRSPWDGAVPQPTDGAECGLLGFALGFINPVVGKGAEFLCQIDARPSQQELDPSAPDLVVLLSAGTSANYQTYTARDAFYHVFRSEFIVPTGAIPPDGLSFTVLDRDGASTEVIGSVRLNRQQLVSAAYSSALLSLDDPHGGLQRLELVVSPYTAEVESCETHIPASEGTAAAQFRLIRAGEVIDIFATGEYQVGSYYDEHIGPRGYPDGGPRGYNFENEPFRSAPHGSALALLGSKDAKMGMVVAPCARFVSKVTGPLVLGINDTEPQNNKGYAQFSVRVHSPSPAEWLGAQTSPCAP